MGRCPAAAFILALSLAPLTGCLGAEDPFQSSADAELELSSGSLALTDGAVITILPALVAPGETGTVATLSLRNSGSAVLEIRSVAITSDPAGALLLAADILPSPGAPVVLSGEAGEEPFTFDVLLARGEEIASLEGWLVIETSETLNAPTKVTLKIVASILTPHLDAQPGALDFGLVPGGQTKTLSVMLVNTGGAPLHVTGLELSGHEGFALAGGESAEPLVIGALEAGSLTVGFTPSGPEAAQGLLRILSDDPAAPDGTTVPLLANAGGPCITVSPKKIDFGGKAVGKVATIDVQIVSCGDQPLTVQGLELLASSAPSFAVALDALPPLPAVLGTNEALTIPVQFVPLEVAAFDDDGQPIPDTGTLRVTTDAYASETEIGLRGFGVEDVCPVPVIIVSEGEEVIPQTLLHLVGSQSYGSYAVAKYAWEVEQPVGSTGVFLPSASAPDPTFEANVAGSYVFRLKVWDAAGTPACYEASTTVLVTPDEAIHVELLWDTPGDDDQTDEGPEAGADLDLHFLHPFATGLDLDEDGAPDGWFDQPFDCFWFNPHPNWAALSPMANDDPGLDRDDTDGAGPENQNLDEPEDGMTYRVGVHYWNDHGFGPSLATVRIYIRKVLVFQVSDVELLPSDMWSVATIDWPSGEVKLVTDAGGAFHITPDYQHPNFMSGH